MITSRNWIYEDDGIECHGLVTLDARFEGKRPAVLVVHDWSGRDENNCNKAKALAELGYLGFAVDMYGGGRLGETKAEKRALMAPLMRDRAALLKRILAAVRAVKNLPEVDAERIVVIGYCFGGLCALDLARSGACIKGVVCFHGLFTPPELPSVPILAKVLVLHGFDDPLVEHEEIHRFSQEMTASNADWQMHLYGGVKHSFTNPKANDPEMGLSYNRLADERAWASLKHFLNECFNQY